VFGAEMLENADDWIKFWIVKLIILRYLEHRFQK